MSIYRILNGQLFILFVNSYLYKDCGHVRSKGFMKNGTYTLWLNDTTPFKVRPYMNICFKNHTCNNAPYVVHFHAIIEKLRVSHTLKSNQSNVICVKLAASFR